MLCFVWAADGQAVPGFTLYGPLQHAHTRGAVWVWLYKIDRENTTCRNVLLDGSMTYVEEAVLFGEIEAVFGALSTRSHL